MTGGKYCLNTAKEVVLLHLRKKTNVHIKIRCKELALHVTFILFNPNIPKRFLILGFVLIKLCSWVHKCLTEKQNCTQVIIKALYQQLNKKSNCAKHFLPIRSNPHITFISTSNFYKS